MIEIIIKENNVKQNKFIILKITLDYLKNK